MTLDRHRQVDRFLKLYRKFEYIDFFPRVSLLVHVSKGAGLANRIDLYAQ